MKESTIERAAVKHAKKLGIGTYKIQGRHNKAAPDRLFFKGNKCLFVEFKAPGKPLTELQTEVATKLIHNHNSPVYHVDDKDYALELIEFHFAEK